jgi:hypothetical protein
MDNSIYHLNEIVKQLLSDIEEYSHALLMHVIKMPRETLEKAAESGFPEDVFSYYMSRYYEKNESVSENVIKYINQSFVPYLKNVSFHLEQAMNEGPGGNSTSSVLADSSPFSKQQGNSAPKPSDDLAYRTYQLIKKSEAQKKNNEDLEKALGIIQGPPMSISEADKQNANPKYTSVPRYIQDPEGNLYWYKGEAYKYRLLPKEARLDMDNVIRCRKNPEYKQEYSVNCATCAAAYALRLRGFDVKAKGNPEKKGNLNTWLSDCHSFDIWNNIDGINAEPSRYADWMKEKGLDAMTPNDYIDFFEEKCKEKGVYIVTIKWEGRGAHATILQRDSDGKLYYIEPQVFDENKTVDGKRNIDDLVNYMAPKQPFGKGVMRVDDKLFNTEYANLFEV